MDRVQDREQLRGLVAVAEHREGDHRPDGGMRVLSAVLSDPGRVSLDVARIERRPIEGRGEEQDQSVLPADEVLVHRRHRAARCAPDRRPRRSRPTTARSNRSGIRRSKPSRAVFRRRSSRADTSRRPRPRARAIARRPSACCRQARRRAPARRAPRPGERRPRAWRAGTSRARRSRPCPRRRPGSCRRSSLPRRRAAGRGYRRRDSGRAPERSARTACASSADGVGSKNESCSPLRSAGPSRKGTISSRTPRSPVTST